MDEALKRLIEFLENASPIVWAAAQQQVQADIIEARTWMIFVCVLGAITLALAVLCTINWALSRGYYNNSHWGLGTVLSWLFVTGFSSIAIAISVYLIKAQANPLWYAVLKLRYLMDLVGN